MSMSKKGMKKPGMAVLCAIFLLVFTYGCGTYQESSPDPSGAAAENKENAPGYAEVYGKLIDEMASSGEADLFSLIQVDDDGIPELAAVNSEGAWDRDQVFLYTAGESGPVLLASDTGPGMEGHFIACFEKQNLFVQSGAATGEGYQFYKIENAEPVRVLSAGHFEQEDEDGETADHYFIDDEETDGDTYLERVRSLLPPDGTLTLLAEAGSTDMVIMEAGFDEKYLAMRETGRKAYQSREEILKKLSE